MNRLKIFIWLICITVYVNAQHMLTSDAEEFWTKANFEAAKSKRQSMEPIRDLTSGVKKGSKSVVVRPRMFVRANFKDAEGNALESQTLLPSELSEEDREVLALNYLSKYKYYNGEEKVNKVEILKKVQRNYGLETTGELSDETMKAILAPRCGNPDGARERYTHFSGSPKWSKTTVTYKIRGYSPDISPCQTRNAFRRAFRLWEKVVELNFVEVPVTEKADIDIYFGFYRHDDLYPFDGPNDNLAHAFPPGYSDISGDTHFDESEFWTNGKGAVTDTYFGNSKGAPCVFPFKFKGKKYKSCTKKGRKDKITWCATTSNFDEDKRWGFCPGPRLFTYGGNGDGNPCRFPFKYEGKTYKTCTTTGRSDGYSWCATTKNFDKHNKWGFCPNEIDTTKGDGYSLYIVAAHEFGHALGLDHSWNYEALMYPNYKYADDLKLHADDIRGAQTLYGSRKSALPELKLETCGQTNIN